MNGLIVPMSLEANCSGASGVSLPLLQTITLNEGTGIWGLVPGVSVNLLNQTVYTPLIHFSQYGLVQGKAEVLGAVLNAF